jgi:hypothetical protein
VEEKNEKRMVEKNEKRMVPPTGEETGVPPLTQIFVFATVALSPAAPPFHAGENLRGENFCIERSMLGQLVRRARQNEEGLYVVLFRFIIQEKERGPHLYASVKYHCQEQIQVSQFSLLVCQEEENQKE